MTSSTTSHDPDRNMREWGKAVNGLHAAVDKLDRVYADASDQLIEWIDHVRSEEIGHTTRLHGVCVGCLTEKIAFAIADVVNKEVR